eukprot:780617-Rhodomonas_salina.4
MFSSEKNLKSKYALEGVTVDKNAPAPGDLEFAQLTFEPVDIENPMTLMQRSRAHSDGAIAPVAQDTASA